VIDFEGAPLAGATVSAISGSAPAGRAVSGADGAFEVYVLPYRSMDVSIRASVIIAEMPYHKFSSRSEAVVFDRIHPDGVDDLMLQVMEGGSVSGQVVNGHGRAVEGVRVEAFESEHIETANAYRDVFNASETDEEGAFKIFVEAPGAYSLV